MKIKSQRPKCFPMISPRISRITPIIFIGLSILVVWLTPAFGQQSQKDVKYEAGFYYTVKDGDTLWDISQRFDDSPWVWPELWKENKQLPNPHWIYPGERIRLYRKSDKHRVKNGRKSGLKPGPQVTTQQTPDTSEPEVNFYFSRMDRVGFIRTPPVQPSGTIFNVLDDKQLVSAGDIVYIQPPDATSPVDFAPGSRFTVYRTVKPTEERNSEFNIGTQHLLLGVVEVSKNESTYAIAKVIEAFRAIEPGDLLMAYQTRAPDIIVTESTPGLEGKLICTENHNNLVSSNTTAFIDKGEDDNIRVGQQYTLFYQETKVGTDGQYHTLAPVDVGSLLVLRTEKTTSTVFITEAHGEITPGFKFKTP